MNSTKTIAIIKDLWKCLLAALDIMIALILPPITTMLLGSMIYEITGNAWASLIALPAGAAYCVWVWSNWNDA